MTVSLFREIRNKWIENGGSPHGIKDNKGFTELLLSITEEKFSIKDLAPKVIETEKLYTGEILRFVLRGKNFWHCFIECSDLFDNVYFDSRAFSGSTDNLVPKAKVEFSIIETKSGKISANKVKLLE